MEQVIKETNAIRHQYFAMREYNSDSIKQLSRTLLQTKYLSQQKSVQLLIEDLCAIIDTNKILLPKTKKYINSLNDQLIFSVFDASYFPDLKIEACFYECLDVCPVLQRKYTTNVVPVNIKQASLGFHSRPVVALFPENHIDKIQLPDDRIFYFIDKFVARFFKVTHKMLTNVVANESLLQLANATYSEIEAAAIQWVWLHEYHHRQGWLPIPKYLSIKSLKPLAGLEELRVDLCSIFTCINDTELPRQHAEMVTYFILAERLLRYAVEGIPHPNYDAIASQLLFNFLRQHGGLFVQGMKIYLTASVFTVLAQLLQTIHDIESSIQTLSPHEVQQKLLDFTKQYTNYNHTDQDFHHIEYFKYVKEKLSV